MPTYTYLIEASDDGLPIAEPSKIWMAEPGQAGTETTSDEPRAYVEDVLSSRLDEAAANQWLSLPLRISVWLGEQQGDPGTAVLVFTYDPDDPENWHRY